jgi:mRNA interferase RelE/StbE
MLRIDLSKQALAFLDALPNKHARQIVGRLDQLACEPDSLPTEALRGGEGERRLKVGEYRVIYAIVSHTLEVILIDRRNDYKIYKRFRRL